MLPLFKATGRKNYAIEAFYTLSYCKLLPPRQAHQIIWSRFVNVHREGIPGHNILCDLHIEHLNRLCKECVRHLGANKTENAIRHFSKCMGPLANILNNFDQKHNVPVSCSSHTIF